MTTAVRDVLQRLALPIAAALLVACASIPSAPRYQEVNARPAAMDRATLYVYRHYAEPTGSSVDIHVGNRYVATLDQRTFTRLDLSPGKYAVRSVWPALSKQSESRAELEISAGATYYLEVTGIYEPRKLATTSAGTHMRVLVGSGINPIDVASAEQALTTCCVYTPAAQSAP